MEFGYNQAKERTYENQLSHQSKDSNKSCNGRFGSHGEMHSIHHPAGMVVFITGTIKTADWIGSKYQLRCWNKGQTMHT